jgi:hypothetical protein
MKRIIVVLLALLLAAPAFAGITVSCSYPSTDSNEVVISYQVSGGDANIPRAFGLDVDVNGATIGSIYGFDPNFYVAPGTYDYNDTSGSVDSWGDPVVDQTPNSFTLEMGSLWASTDPEHPCQPPSSGTLCKFTVSKCCTVNIAENAARTGGDANGVIMEDTAKSFAKSYVTLSGCQVCSEAIECMYGYTDYAEWVSVYSPECWCYDRQCHGDADNRSEGKKKYWASTLDLDVLTAAWNKPIADLVDGNGTHYTVAAGGVNVPLICADFDHRSEGKKKYRASTLDLDILTEFWNIADGPDPNCEPNNRPLP